MVKLIFSTLETDQDKTYYYVNNSKNFYVPEPALHFIKDEVIKHQIYDIYDSNIVQEHLFNEGRLDTNQVKRILHDSKKIFKKEANLLRIKVPSYIIGDTHGQYYDLINILNNFNLKKDTLLFLGDYVDRGQFSIEVYLYLLNLKIQHPNNIFLLRGNHETERMTTYFTFKQECLQKYSEKIYKKFIDSFNYLPLAATVMNDLYCAHGGISPEMTNVNQINLLNRFKEPTFTGLFCDILWSDPNPKFKSNLSYAINIQRNCSFYYSYKAVKKFLSENNLKCIVRGHEVQNLGFNIHDKTEKMVITIFSAPNYCDAYNNLGAILFYNGDNNVIYNFKSARHPFYLPNYLDAINWSFPFISEKISEFFLDLLKFIELQEELSISESLDKMSLSDITEENSHNLNSSEDLIADELEATKTFTGAMAIMRNERECINEIEDEESTELPCCSLKNVDMELTYDKAKENDKTNEMMKTENDWIESSSTENPPSCANAVSKQLQNADIENAIKESVIEIKEDRKVLEIKVNDKKIKKNKK